MKITSTNLPKTVKCPTSKSYANRALILSALKVQDITLYDLPLANDVKDMIRVLRKLGITFLENNNVCTVQGSFPKCELVSDEVVQLNLGEGGTTSRFLFPLLCLGRNTYEVTLEGFMAKRPMQELIEYLKGLGAKITKLENGNFQLQGPLSVTGKLEVDCSDTTQFASALMNLELVSDLEVTPVKILASEKYLNLTRDLISLFRAKNEYFIPADFSSAGYFIAHAILSGELIIENIHSVDDLQADSIFIKHLKSVGATIGLTEQGLRVEKVESFSGAFDIDGSTCLDLVPTLIFVATFLPEKSIFRNIKNLRFKECDRLEEMQKILDQFNIKYTYSDQSDTLEIIPSKILPRKESFRTANDHRMVMVLSLFYKQCGGGEVSPASSVSKSFPEFFNFFQ